MPRLLPCSASVLTILPLTALVNPLLTFSDQTATLPGMNDMMGGFFGAELPKYHNFPFTESDTCVFCNSGRTALDCILRNLPHPRRVYLPRFTCDTLTEPLTGLPTVRYGCEENLAPILPDDAGEEDIIILTDYFGLTANHVNSAAAQFPGLCIVDATTALFRRDSGNKLPAFYSPRKFAGVPDGGIASAPFPLIQRPLRSETSSEYSLHLFQRTESGAAAAAPAAQRLEDSLRGKRLLMSPLSRKLLSSIDFAAAAQKRKENYLILHRALRELNHLPLPEQPDSPPMCYPFVSGIPGLRDDLIDAGIALPLFWPEVIASTHPLSMENKLARTLLPLPLDQRYDRHDMQRLLHLILRN